MRYFLLLFIFIFGVSHAKIDLRFGEHGDYTRIVLEADDEPLYRIFSIPNPSRLVIDLRESDFTKSALVGKGLVEKYRVGQFEAGVNRIVIDFRDNFSVKEFFTIPEAGKFRVVIDVVASGSTPEFLRLAESWESYRAKSEDKEIAKDVKAGDIEAGDIEAGDIKIVRAPIPPDFDKKVVLPLIVIDPGHGGCGSGFIGS